MAQLPGIDISENKDAIGVIAPSRDGVAALLVTATLFPGILEDATPYQIFGLADAAALNIDAANNPFAYAQLAQFYAGRNGAELWFMPIPDTLSMADAFDPAGNYAPKLAEAAGGDIRLMGISANPAVPSAVANGLEGDVHTAAVNAQTLANQFRSNHQPFSVLIDGRGFSGTPGDLTDYSTGDQDSVSILIGGAQVGDIHSAMGNLLGSLASLPVQRRISRKRNGSVGLASAVFTDGQLVDDHTGKFTSIAAKNYIFYRTYTGKPGYFFSTDSTLAQGDFSTISSRRVMDKVRRLAHEVYTEWLDEEITVDTGAGTIAEQEIEQLQQDINNEINLQMVSKGELSAFVSFVDPSQNVLSTNELRVQLQPTPVGYATQFNIEVSFNNPFA